VHCGEAPALFTGFLREQVLVWLCVSVPLSEARCARERAREGNEMREVKKRETQNERGS